MKYSELNKGDRVRLRNGWYATIMDNLRNRTIRLCLVEGIVTEAGSVYAHDIMCLVKVQDTDDTHGEYIPIEHTDKQKQLRHKLRTAGFV